MGASTVQDLFKGIAGCPLMQILGWITVAAVGVVLVVNGLFMVLAPRAWFRLPSWIPGRGSLTEKRYGSGLGAIQVRMGGAIFLGVIIWVLYDSLLRPR
jgi:hypothetical protein